VSRRGEHAESLLRSYVARLDGLRGSNGAKRANGERQTPRPSDPVPLVPRRFSTPRVARTRYGEQSLGFFPGHVRCPRYRVEGSAPKSFGPEYLEKLATRAIGKQKAQSKDGTEAGWTAGEDILDLGFDLAKNVANDTLHFAIRIDTQNLPGDLLRAYARAELQALAAENASGRPSAKQKKEARETARARLEAEAKDGRFTRRKACPVLWDALGNQVLVGTTSASALDQAQRLFQETFGCGLALLDAGAVAAQHVEAGKQQGRLADLRPAAFVPGNGAPEVAWVSDPASQGYLGNELLLWLWYALEAEGDTLPLPDESEVTVMLARTLVLECPRGISGNETIRSGSPTQLPEARRAIQAGKLPRQAGLVVVRHDQQYELTLQAETRAVSGAKLPPVVDRGQEVSHFDGAS
jgi:hypothetical protein